VAVDRNRRYTVYVVIPIPYNRIDICYGRADWGWSWMTNDTNTNISTILLRLYP
jgi:hypothetical protein